MSCEWDCSRFRVRYVTGSNAWRLPRRLAKTFDLHQVFVLRLWSFFHHTMASIVDELSALAITPTESTDPPTTPNDASPFFAKLPAEIRLKIYEEVFKGEEYWLVRKCYRETHPVKAPPLIQVCHQIRGEALPVFHTEATVMCCLHCSNNIWRDHLSMHTKVANTFSASMFRRIFMEETSAWLSKLWELSHIFTSASDLTCVALNPYVHSVTKLQVDLQTLIISEELRRHTADLLVARYINVGPNPVMQSEEGRGKRQTWLVKSKLKVGGVAVVSQLIRLANMSNDHRIPACISAGNDLRWN